MDRVDVVIIGGGVVGCAIACALAGRWEDVFVLEELPRLGMLTSTRNSGVIHSGIYYPPDSLKARHCVRGNQLLYEFCAAHGVPYRKTGKIVVAYAEPDVGALVRLMENGRANGVDELRIIDRATFRAREPHVEGFCALEVPSTGILSSEDLVKTFARLAVDRGAHILNNAKVKRLESLKDAIRVTSEAGEIETRCLVNSAGLFADEVAALLPTKMAHNFIYPVRGEYCELVPAKRDWVRGLVYPLTRAAGMSLGVHLTKTLWGNVLVGPTARYIADKRDYESDRETIEQFAYNASLLLPEIQPSDLVPAYSGIRPKLIPPISPSVGGKTMADFIIQRDPEFPRVVHLIGIESPGLTSAPSIAEHVLQLAGEILN
ncbi:MAG TPA: NAD(P)/FAD-dependent oxidoreductase [Verrucomicrobiae bacterium]|nr:NAD(P)/FAD-dependent oxidoreductase [Verrucomicrobiae bacterium]